MTTAFPGAMAPPTGPVDMGAGYGVGGAMPGPAYMIQGAVGEPAVAFDPVPQEISFNPGSVLHGFPGISSSFKIRKLAVCWYTFSKLISDFFF